MTTFKNTVAFVAILPGVALAGVGCLWMFVIFAIFDRKPPSSGAGRGGCGD